MAHRILLLFLVSIVCMNAAAQKVTAKKKIAVIAYYAGRTTMIDSFEVEKIKQNE